METGNIDEPKRPSRGAGRGWRAYVICVAALTLASWGTVFLDRPLAQNDIPAVLVFNGPLILAFLLVSGGHVTDAEVCGVYLFAPMYWALFCFCLIPLEFFERHIAVRFLLLGLAIIAHLVLSAVAMFIIIAIAAGT